MKKFGKRVEAEKLQERAKRKRKANALEDDTEGVQFDLGLLEEGSTGAKDLLGHRRKKPKIGPNGRPLANAKRRYKNEKYGFGGKTRHKKSNPSDTVNNFEADFHRSRKKAKDQRGGPSARGGKKGGARKKPKRPGKNARKRS